MADKPLSRMSLANMCRAVSKQPRRALSSSGHLQRSGGSGAAAVNSALLGQMKEQRSMQSRMQQVKEANIPDDMGLMPETLVKPANKDLPPLLSQKWRRRLQIEWLALTQKATDLWRLIYLTQFYPRKDPLTGRRERMLMYLPDRAKVVRELHRDLYQAFAAGDREKIERIACAGLSKQLLTKLDHRQVARKPDQKLHIAYSGFSPGKNWEDRRRENAPLWYKLYRIARWLPQVIVPPRFKSTQIIYDRMTPLPIGDKAFLRQVVAKVRSQQSLDRNDGTPQAVMKSNLEYVVIQKLWLSTEEMPWKIWGTTQPSDEAAIDTLLKTKTAGGSMMDKFKDSMMGKMGGGSGSTTGMM